MTELVGKNPAVSAAALAGALRMSERAFCRWFRADVGTSFTCWRRAHLVERAIAQLHRGASVKCVAAELGYASTSAFIAMFKRMKNVPPQQLARGESTPKRIQ